ncbi:MAG: pyridoxal phosphate-dependent aminotransferase [Saprospiraceae bacterium]
MISVTSDFQKAARLGGVTEYYFSRKLREIGTRRANGEDIINLGIGNPDLPPPSVLQALGEDLQEPMSHGYQSYRGTVELRDSLQQWYKSTYSVELSDQEILPLAGSKEGIVHLALAYLQTGTTILFPNPGYPAYAAASKLAQAQALPYPMPESDESAASWIKNLEQVIAGHDVKLLFVNSPHMPTGQVLSTAHLLALIAFAKTHKILIVSDNAYGYYHPDGPQSLLQLEGAKEQVVELNSLSKSHHMAGWRLGVLAGRADVINAALQVKSNLDSGQFRPVQRGATAALATPYAWHTTQRKELLERRTMGEQLLASIGCTVPSGQHGLFVWANIPAHLAESEGFCDSLLDATGVFIPPGTVFGDAGEKFLRLSLCSPKPVLAEALKRCTSSTLAI